jgi:hypothetical protein
MNQQYLEIGVLFVGWVGLIVVAVLIVGGAYYALLALFEALTEKAMGYNLLRALLMCVIIRLTLAAQSKGDGTYGYYLAQRIRRDLLRCITNCPDFKNDLRKVGILFSDTEKFGPAPENANGWYLWRNSPEWSVSEYRIIEIANGVMMDQAPGSSMGHPIIVDECKPYGEFKGPLMSR